MSVVPSQRQSTTEKLLKRCEEMNEVSRAEVDMIIPYWISTEGKPQAERSKDLKSFLDQQFPKRAQAIWKSMTKHQTAMTSQSSGTGVPLKKNTKVASVMDDLLRPGEGQSIVSPPEGGDRGVLSQDLLGGNLQRQETENAKRSMYESLGSVPGSGKDPGPAKVGSKGTMQGEISSAASAAAKEKLQHPVPTDLNWSQFNVVDKDALTRIIQNVNSREGVPASAATGKLLSMAVQQQACRILAAGVHNNSSRQSKDTVDDFSRLMGLSEKKGRDVYSMSFGPDIYGSLVKSENNCRNVCRAIGEDGERVINEEKMRHDAFVANNITKPGKRKIDETETGTETPWWIQEGQAEEKGLADWATIAKLHIVDQVIGLERAAQRRIVRPPGAIDHTGSAFPIVSMGGQIPAFGSYNSNSSSSSSTRPGTKSADEKLRLFNKIKQECPLVTGTGGRDANVLTRQDIAEGVADSVRQIFPSNVGFGVGSQLGRGAVRAKLKINQAPAATN